MAKVNQHLKATTLLESLVAVVIISLCFTAGLFTVSKTITAYQGQDSHQGLNITDSLIQATITDQFFFDQEGETDQYNYSVKISDYPNQPELKVIEATAQHKAGGQPFRQQLIYHYEGR